MKLTMKKKKIVTLNHDNNLTTINRAIINLPKGLVHLKMLQTIAKV
jgi:hypothetical protein